MSIRKKIKIILLLIIISRITCFGQKYFNATYDNNSNVEGFSSVIQMMDSGYVAVGTSKVFGVAYNYYALRTDKKGNKVHEAYFEIPNVEIVLSSIKKNDSSSLITCGLIMDQDSALNRYNRDVFLAKTTNDGDTIWTKRFRKGIGTSTTPDFEAGKVVIVAQDGGFVIAGYTSYSVNLGYQIYVIKTDSLGNLLWEQTYGGANSDDVYEIIETPDKGFLLTGYTYSYGAGDRDGYLIKTDSLGNFQWQKTYGGGGNDGLSGACRVRSGGYLLSGWTKTNFSLLYQSKLWFIKVDDNGNQQWNKTNGGDYSIGEIDKLVQLEDSTYVGIGGISDSTGIPISGVIMKISLNGDSIWCRKYKRAITMDDYFFNFSTTNDGGFIITGQVPGQGSVSGTQDGWLVKVDCMGADSITHYFGDTCYTNPIGINEIKQQQNREVWLMDNFPNPFEESTTIKCYLPDEQMKGELSITDITGRLVQKYNLEKGFNNIEFKTGDLKAGVYYYSMYVYGNLIDCKKMILIK